MQRVYLDANATAPLWPEAIEAVVQTMRESWGNASSIHTEGRQAAEVAQRAREALADWTQTRALEWILTSGGTESIHAALHGVAVLAQRSRKMRIVTSRGEHACSLGVMADLERMGFEITTVGLRSDGSWDPAEVLEAVDSQTALVSLIWANNETGAVSPVAELAAALRARRIPLHLDAVQAFGRLEVDLARIPAALVSLSAHKFGGPKGMGALFVRQGTAWVPWMKGGNQERSRRGGTVNVAGAAGMAAAIACVQKVDVAGIAAWRKDLEAKVLSLPKARILGVAPARLPNTICLCLPGCDSSTLLDRLDARGVAVASGSACSTGVAEPSHVLLAMGVSPEDAHATIRISLGPWNTMDALERFLLVLGEEVARVRGRTMAFQ